MGRPPAAAVVSHLGYRTAAAVDGMIIGLGLSLGMSEGIRGMAAEMEQPKTALNLLCKSVKKKVRKFYGNAPASGPGVRCRRRGTPARRSSAHFLHERIGYFEVGVDVLHVVVVVERLDQVEHFLAAGVVERDGILRLPQQRRLAWLA